MLGRQASPENALGMPVSVFRERVSTRWCLRFGRAFCARFHRADLACPGRGCDGHMRDWYSTVGRFLHLASSRKVATVLPLAGLAEDLGLAGIEKRFTANATCGPRGPFAGLAGHP